LYLGYLERDTCSVNGKQGRTRNKQGYPESM
jgi:hypothetical protein